jgi:hypothetical protein
MTNQLTELVLHLSRVEGNLVATLLGPAGQVLASQPVTLDVAALRQMVGPEVYGRALTEAVLDGPLGQATGRDGTP